MKYVIKRFVMMAVSIWVIITITFLIMHAIPGKPGISENGGNERSYLEYQKKYGLDEPLYIQYLEYCKDLAAFDFGESMVHRGVKVTDILRKSLPITFRIGLLSLFMTLMAAIPIGIISGYHPASLFSHFILKLSTLGMSLPSFVVATVVIYLFSYKLRWFPSFGTEQIKSYFLPAISLSVFDIGFVTLLVNNSVKKVLAEPYFIAIKAKGLSNLRIAQRHIFRNIGVTILASSGHMLTYLFTGAFVVESIFAMPGMGLSLINAILGRDYNVVFSLVFVYAVIYVVLIFLLDVFMNLIDPRVKEVI